MSYYVDYAELKRKKREKRERKQQRLQQEIMRYAVANKLAKPDQTFTFSPSAARYHGHDVYWAKCKYGHIGPRKVTAKGAGKCTDCDTIHKKIRDAKKRGTQDIKLTIAEKNETAEIYRRAKALSESTGIEHHVDHIRPLAAGGLHHPANLQILPAKENMSKGSKYNGKRRKYSTADKREYRKKHMEKKQAERMRREEKENAERIERNNNRPWWKKALGIYVD